MSRISYRNYPILEKIKNRKLGDIICVNEDKDLIELNLDFVNKLFYEKSPCFDSNILFPSKPFLEAVEKSYYNIKDIMMEEKKKDFSLSGTIVYSKETILLYSFIKKNGIPDFNFFFTSSNGYFRAMVHIDNSNYKIIRNKTKCYDQFSDEDFIDFMFNTTFQINTFKKYAKVETVYSKAKSKTKEMGCKYMNETDLDVQYLDSKWFTTLVNSEGFNVRGHFRLQPKKKDGKWTKQLIWIDDFEKKGYNRQAGILNQPNPVT